HDTAYRLAAEHASAAATVEPGPAWRQMLELGWQGVLVAEAAGGAGATLQDLAAIVEGIGRAGLTVPLADRCGVAPVALAAADSEVAVALL
ncbi:acyl-CoA dehydrogenase family protein, partial [Acinetobacter baumannii]